MISSGAKHCLSSLGGENNENRNSRLIVLEKTVVDSCFDTLFGKLLILRVY